MRIRTLTTLCTCDHFHFILFKFLKAPFSPLLEYFMFVCVEIMSFKRLEKQKSMSSVCAATPPLQLRAYLVFKIFPK